MDSYYVINYNNDGFGSLRFGIETSSFTNIIFDNNYGYSIINLNSTIHVLRDITIINNSLISIRIKGDSSSIFTLDNSGITFGVYGNGFSLIDTEGGAIRNIFSSNTITLDNVHIHNCSASYGGAIFTFGPLILQGCTFISNTALYVGGAVFSCNSLTVDNCEFSQNMIISESEYIGGAGLFVFADTNSTNLTFNISNTIITHNFVKFNPLENTGASGAGVMILIFDYIITFTNCVIENNLSKNGSGIMAVNGNIACIGCVIQNNVATNYVEEQDPRIKPVLTGGGCGITSMVGTVNVDNCKITGNKSYGMYSSGIVGFSGDVTCTNSDISNNINAGPGGGIAVNLNCNLTVSDSIISNNSASGLGGAIINFSNNLFTTALTNCEIKYNQLDNRENLKSAFLNIAGTTESYINFFIDFIINITGRLTVVTGIIQNIYDTILTLEVLAGIYASRNIVNNPTINTYADFIGGGALCIFDNCLLTIMSSTISNNNIVVDIKESYGVTNYTAVGGAIFSVLSDDFSIYDSIIQYNQCNGVGGAIFNNGSLLNITDVNIMNNLLIPVAQSASANQSLLQNGAGLFISPGVNQYGISSGSTTNITTSAIDNNVGLYFGGGIYNGGGNLYLNSSYIYSNVVFGTGGGIYQSNDLSFPIIPSFTYDGNTQITNNLPNNITYNYEYIDNIPNPKFPYPSGYSSIYDASGDIQWIFVGPQSVMQQLFDSKDIFVQLMTTPTLINVSPQMLIGVVPANFVLDINGIGETVYYVNKTLVPDVDLWFFVDKAPFYFKHINYYLVTQKFYPTDINDPYTIYDADANGAKYIYLGKLKDILEVYYTDILIKTIFVNPVIIKGYYTPPSGYRLFYQNNDPVYTTVQIWFIAPVLAIKSFV